MAGSPCWFPALLLLLPLPPPALPRRASGCAARGLCCPGRDAACLSTGRRPDGSTGPCYCDQACARTLDCCHDYAQACTVIPCVVSQWSAWSGCAEPCKTTYRVRMRHIIQEPRNGGEACPALEERAGCVEYWTRQGTECQQSLSTVWSSSSWPSRWAACTATTHTLAGCITSGRATPSAWSVSTRLCTPRVSIAMAMAPAAKRISCCTGRQWGTIDAREPGGEFASWTLVPALLFTASCSSDFSWQSQQAPVCGSSRSQNNDFSVLEALLSLPFQRLQAVQGHLESSLSVCAPQFPKQSGCLGSADLFFPLRESCLTLMTSCKFPLF